ncbi:hypothetical protein IGI04_023848 [Brassica rapa subsp. trilocularis]|uniref:Uncharacterized protein n=1 Tax=Brassica rapa subsp. trilocularis TaxID=1813537 RepID=A0ABQ7M512_BRACM|nr:hypothetical protein IGI04_023848 [Brassica rapa subsp. trilocularis]
MFRLHFAYMSLYQVLEYHMEFLRTFGCIWSSKEVFKVIIGRAAHGSDQSAATPSKRPYQSDREESLAFSSPGDARTSPERPLAATQRGRSRSLERLVGATSRGRCALSDYLHSRCFDISQNWFDNLLYYNICLRSLENS